METLNSPSREDLLSLIGIPTNDELRRLDRMITYHKYNDDERVLLRQMILNAKPKRRRKKEEEEWTQ